MTDSGYPRIVKQWQRGTPLASATLVYEGKADDMYIAATRDHTPGFERDFVSRTIAFYNDELYLRGKDGKLTKVDAPNSANKSVHHEWLLLRVARAVDGRRQDLSRRRAAGDEVRRLHGRQARLRRAVRSRPTRTSLAEFVWTKRPPGPQRAAKTSRTAHRADAAADGLEGTAVAGAPASAPSRVGAVDTDDSDAVWLTVHRLPARRPRSSLRRGRRTRAGSAQVESGVLRRLEARHRAAFRHLARTARASRTSWCGRRT